MTDSAFLGGDRPEPVFPPPTLAARVLDWLGELHRRAAHRRHVELSIRQLREFDDHLLRDLGVSRGDIESRVRG
jgi:uncharacterized protein YjiS (DUF1127 family)